MSHIAVYLRVSSRKQDTRSQEPDLERWLAAYAAGETVRWYRDQATGRTMDRPGWKKLTADMDAGNVSKIVVWRLDRLGRTASGLTALFDTPGGAQSRLGLPQGRTRPGNARGPPDRQRFGQCRRL